MNDPSANPQEVFRSQLPAGASLIVIFVPSRDRDGQPIDQEYWVDEMLTTLGRLFRGATAYPRGRGFGVTTNVVERCSKMNPSSFFRM
jgi:hypothetical protein